jgi:release factor glutamine methyltransferase
MSTLSSVTSGSWLKSASRRLECSDISSAHLDTLIILEDCLKQNRALLLAHPERILTTSQVQLLNKQVKQRAKHIPLAYIRHQSEFYGRTFYVDKRVLEPRPETETMIDLFKQLPIDNKATIADVGTGSGCIGLTVQLENPDMKVDLYDNNPGALMVARLNTKRFKLANNCYHSDLLKPNHGPYQVIMANLPYVPDDYNINAAALIEPRGAIFGGVDGLDIYRRFWQQINTLNWQPNYVLTETLPFQHEKLIELALRYNFQLIKTDDFIQCFKKFN